MVEIQAIIVLAHHLKHYWDSNMDNKQIISKVLQRFNLLKSERSNFENMWQILAEYVWTKKANFTSSQTVGTFLNNKLFDNKAQLNAKSRASTLKSMVFGNFDFKFSPVGKNKDDDGYIKFFEKATEIIKQQMQNQNSGFDKCLTEAEDFDAVFGTDIIFCDFKDKKIYEPKEQDGQIVNILTDDKSHLSYKTLDLKECFLDEDAEGNVNYLFRSFTLTVEQCKEKFGIESLHKNLIEQLKSNSNTRIPLINAIIPISGFEYLFDIKTDFEYIGLYIDLSNQHLMSFTGYYEKPFFVHRENKKPDEKYGRSVSMDAISTISLINRVSKDIILMFDRAGEPPIGITDDKAVVDTSSGSITVFSPQDGQPIFNLFNETGNPAVMVQWREQLYQELSNFYGLDKLLDFNNQTQMTAEEARMRAQIRNQTLSDLVSNRVNERYTPLLQRTFNLLLINGYFDEILTDDFKEALSSVGDVYQIQYYNQFEREKNEQNNQAIMNIWNIANNIAVMKQDLSVFDTLNADNTIAYLKNVSPINNIFNGDVKIEQLREERHNQQELMMTMQQQEGVK